MKHSFQTQGALGAIGIAILVLVGTSSAPGAEMMASKSKLKAKPRMTHSQLKKLQKKTGLVEEDRSVTMKELKPTVRRQREGGGSLIDRSAIISSGTHWTIVPKGAVFYVPGHYKTRLGGKRTGRLLPWKDFLAANRSWISVQSVTIEQARGEAIIDEKLRQQCQTVGKLVVSVCKGGPISVKPPVEEKAVVKAGP